MEWLVNMTYCGAVMALVAICKRYGGKVERNNRIEQSRKAFAESLDDVFGRMSAERKLLKVMNAELKEQTPPMRKACGLFSGEDAQEMLK